MVARNTDIPRIVLQETNQKIVHKLEHPHDVETLAKTLGLGKSQKESIKFLPPGVCFFKSSGTETKLVRVLLS